VLSLGRNAGPSGAERLRVGAPLPNVAFMDETGNAKYLKDYLKGRLVMVVLPNRSEETYAEYLDRIVSFVHAHPDLAVVQVSYSLDEAMDGSPRSALPPAEGAPLAFAFVCDPKGIVRRELGFGSEGRFVVVDKKGAVAQVGRLSNRRDLDRAFNRLLAPAERK